MKLAAIVVALAFLCAPSAPAQTTAAQAKPAQTKSAQAKTAKTVKATKRPDSMPLSAKSTKVRRLIEEAWVLDSDKGEPAKAIEAMRKVVKAEPKFAMGHEILAQISLDPAEQVREQHLAFENKGNANSAEQTVIDWLQNASDHNLIPAITNMNEVLRQYPHDRWVVFLANSWLMTQTQYQRAVDVYENSGIKNSPGLMNNAAYTYAHMRQFKKAFALMEQYVKMMPHDANPNDSYAELLRMAGHYNSAIEHYRAALAINPHFYTSAYGIADTYLLMGQEDRARKEYEKASQTFPVVPEMERVQWKTREATTYLYEGDLAGANKAFQALADYAHSKKMSQIEADTYRQMALYQARHAEALVLLKKAEKALQAGENASASGIHQEAAMILRARVELGIESGELKAVDVALTSLAELSEESNDKMIDSAYQGAEGARLFAAHKYKAAIPHLEEDKDNPFSLRRLAKAYRETGYVSGAKRTDEALATFSDPTIEQALVVPPFRKCLGSPNCNANLSAASMKH
ncbi:MAG TPA: tetratricopeptide repeat protein [Terriglobales bacterium]|nr:tetratricopeptide repeat protein [Terriglobales bacterium]